MNYFAYSILFVVSLLFGGCGMSYGALQKGDTTFTFLLGKDYDYFRAEYMRSTDTITITIEADLVRGLEGQKLIFEGISSMGQVGLVP